MCERSRINTDPDVDISGQIVDSQGVIRDVVSEHKTPRIDVGPIFGTTKKTEQDTEMVGAKTNAWFRQNGGI